MTTTTNTSPTYTEPTFRVWPAETITEKDGSVYTRRLCEELVAGRWEPFYSHNTAR